jgi:hypothetical protein
MSLAFARRTLIASVALVAAVAPLSHVPAGATPAAGRNLIKNGCFDAGSGSKPYDWGEIGAANRFAGEGRTPCLYAEDLVILTGLPSPAVWQSVSIPATATQPALSFWTRNWNCAHPTTIFSAEILATGHVHVLQTLPGKTCDNNWHESVLSVRAFHGKTVSVKFIVSGTHNGDVFYVDDVRLTA